MIVGPWLGPGDDRPDPELDGIQHSEALGDDFDPSPETGDDEDGAWFPPLIQELPTNFVIEVSGADGGSAVVEGWLDFDGDEAWHNPGEAIAGDL